MPGFNVGPAEKLPGDTKTPMLVTLPRAQLQRLIELLDELENGGTVILKDAERYLVWSTNQRFRSGNVYGFCELGLSGRSRAEWVLGTATIKGLRKLLSEPADGPREIIEMFGKVASRSWVLVELTGG